MPNRKTWNSKPNLIDLKKYKAVLSTDLGDITIDLLLNRRHYSQHFVFLVNEVFTMTPSSIVSS